MSSLTTRGMQGICTQVTDVKPLMTVATYLDDATGYEVYQEVLGTPVACSALCLSAGCCETLIAQAAG